MRRILVVPETLAGALPAALRDRPTFEVRSAPGPAEALELTSRWPPELVILGPELAEAEALGLARRLRADRRLAELRILLVSDAVPRGPAGAVIHAEVDAHLVGPTPNDLLRAMGVLLDVATIRPPRLAHDLLVRVAADPANMPGTGAAPEPMLANLLGLTETSCQLECAQPLQVGATVRLDISLPAGDPLVVHAIVLAADDLQLHYGCELLDADPDVRARIRLFLSEGPAGGD